MDMDLMLVSGGLQHQTRRLHQSAISLGDAAPCYTSTHTQSYSGGSADGRPLIFHLRDPRFPPQHQDQLDVDAQISKQNIRNSRVENWARHHGGQAVREIANPQGPSEYRTTYRSEHSLPVTDGSPRAAGGRPTRWHRHNILTGEQGQTAGPGRPSRRSRDKLLHSERRWETDCSALRLY